MTFPRASRLGLTTVALLLSVTVGANATPAKEPVAAQNAGDPIATAIDEASRRFGIPEAWIRAVMRVESNGDRRAVSRAGAMGLMQVMPATYADLRRPFRRPRQHSRGHGLSAPDVRSLRSARLFGGLQCWARALGKPPRRKPSPTCRDRQLSVEAGPGARIRRGG